MTTADRFGHASGRGVVIVLLGTLLGSVSPVAASDAAATGQTGQHFLVDNRVHPGAACVYSRKAYPRHLVKMRIGAPVVHAFDRRAGREDRQWIGWRYIIETDRGIRYRSPIRKALATDRTPAELTERWWSASGVGYWSSVTVQVRWYRKGRVVGRARLEPRYYRYRPDLEVYMNGCSGV